MARSKVEPSIFRFRPTVWHIALLLPWILAILGFKRAFNDNSYLWHVRAGDIQMLDGSVLTADPFSFTRTGDAWRTQSWLAELAYSRLDAWDGLSSTPWITASMTVLLFVLLGLTAFRSNRSVPSTVVYSVASVLLLAAFLNPRPAILSLPLFAAVVVVDSSGRIRWTLPGILWIWASIHGSFVIGIVYLGLRAIGRGITPRRLLELTMIGIPTLVTAHGWGVVEMLLAFARSRDALSLMTEWYPPELISAPFLPLLAGLFGLMFLASKGQIRRADWWIIVPFTVLALSAARAVPQAWIALGPILGRLKLKEFSPTTVASPGLAVFLAGLIIIGPILIPYRVEPAEGLFPVEAVRHLETDRVFHDDLVGAWIIYRQWPDRLVFIDDRAEFFGDRIGEMARLRGGLDEWASIFSRDGIREALLGINTPLARVLELAGWQPTFSDEFFVVLRSPPADAEGPTSLGLSALLVRVG